MNLLTLSEKFRSDLSRATRILQEEGCKEIYLFGSVAREQERAESDLDIAVRGCPKGKFFALLGRLLLELDGSVDLVNLDMQVDLAQYFEREGRLVQVA